MREEAKRMAELYQALADGKTLQTIHPLSGQWYDSDCDLAFQKIGVVSASGIRIKPEPKKVYLSIALHRDEILGVYCYEMALGNTVADHARVEQKKSFVNQQ